MTRWPHLSLFLQRLIFLPVQQRFHGLQELSDRIVQRRHRHAWQAELEAVGARAESRHQGAQGLPTDDAHTGTPAQGGPGLVLGGLIWGITHQKLHRNQFEGLQGEYDNKA